MKRTIRKVPQTISMERKKRVCAYARVSSGKDAMLHSLSAQISSYSRRIQSHTEWQFAGVYVDEAKTGTKDSRENFQRMLDDCRNGQIDIVITKSISRFARNTVDSLSTIRKLKDARCECFFEKEGIYTFDGKGELLITIMSSLAQEESRSISENITWGHRKSFSDGKVYLAYKHFLGYKKGPDGRPEIVEEEAEIVRLIYRLFLDGKTAGWIGKHLEQLGIPSPSGKKKWYTTTITSILTNEKYKGDALLQKKFTVDFLEKKVKRNQGEVPQYYVERSHPAIIDPNEWELVQQEFARRHASSHQYSCSSVLASKLVCEDCGGFFGSKVWHSTDKYRKVVWQCNQKYAKGHRCHTPSISEKDIHQAFLKAYNQLMSGKQELIRDCEAMRRILTDCMELDAQIAAQTSELQVVSELVDALVSDNASSAKAQDAYTKNYESLVERYHAAEQKLSDLRQERKCRSAQKTSISRFIRALKEQAEFLDEWDDTIWMAMVEKAVVHRDGTLTFGFYNGVEISI